MFLAKGHTRSALHYDKENIFFCLYRGRKDWVLLDTRKYGRLIRGDQFEDDPSTLASSSNLSK